MTASTFMHEPQLLITKHCSTDQKKNLGTNVVDTTDNQSEENKDPDLLLLRKKSFLHKKLISTLSSAHSAITNGVKLIDADQHSYKFKRKISNISCNAGTFFSAVNHNPISAWRKSTSINESLRPSSRSFEISAVFPLPISHNKNHKVIDSGKQISASQTIIGDGVESYGYKIIDGLSPLGVAFTEDYNFMVNNDNSTDNKIYTKRKSSLSTASCISAREKAILEKRKPELSNISALSAIIFPEQSCQQNTLKTIDKSQSFSNTNHIATAAPNRVPIAYNSQYCYRQHSFQQNLIQYNHHCSQTSLNQKSEFNGLNFSDCNRKTTRKSINNEFNNFNATKSVQMSSIVFENDQQQPQSYCNLNRTKSYSIAETEPLISPIKAITLHQKEQATSNFIPVDSNLRIIEMHKDNEFSSINNQLYKQNDINLTSENTRKNEMLLPKFKNVSKKITSKNHRV